MIDFRSEAEALRDDVIALRRDFHQHPELAFEEIRTSGIVRQQLSEMGLEVQAGVGKTGVVALLEGEKEGPTVLVRADMDALPIIEDTGLPFASQMQGKMHACGHDGHTAIALGVAKLLSKHRHQISGRIKFVFQPAEEIAGGAKAMMADGVLGDPRPDVALGLHLWNGMPFGKLGMASGAVMAGVSDFKIRINGRGGHGAAPMLSLDPVVCAAQVITALQTIVSRNVAPLDSAVVSVTIMRAGDAHNVIPQYADLAGTIRFYRVEVRDLVVRRMQEIAAGIAQGMGCIAETEFIHHLMPVTNDDRVAERIRSVVSRIIPHTQFEDYRTMGAEDMGVFLDEIPGMYFFVGAHIEDRDLTWGHHHPRFDFDENALPLSVALMSAAVASYVIAE
jgi:amidohydrolase